MSRKQVNRLRVAILFPGRLHSPRATPTRARLNVEAVKESVQLLVISEDEPDCGDLSPVSESIGSGTGNTQRGFLNYTRKALQKLNHFQPDVIHAVTTVAALPAVLYKRRHPETRLVFEMHGLSYFEQQGLQLSKRLGLGFLDYWGAKHAGAIIAMSYSQRELICRYFRIPPKKVYVLWGPVDLNLFCYQELPPAPPFVVGYCGNDCFWQGLETIFAACRLLEAHPAVRFLLMGFPAEKYLGLGLRNVTFTGPLPREVVPEHLGRCHILLSPRIRHRATETQYPFKLSAYLAVGRPVIVTAVNDQQRVIEQAVCGYVVPPGDAAALAQRIAAVARLPESELVQLGRNARSFAEANLSLTHLRNRLLELYTG